MKNRKIFIAITFIILLIVTPKLLFAKRNGNRELYVTKREQFLESIEVAGTFQKTATDREKAKATADYQSAISQLSIANQNKMTQDATMWAKQQILLNSKNSVDYKNDNTINPSTKKEYTELEKQSIDTALIQAEKDFRAAETKYKEADIQISAAASQVNFTKIILDELLEDEPVLTVNINEVYFSRIYVGQPVKVVFDSKKDYIFDGKIVSIDNVGTNNNGYITFETKIAIEKLTEDIRPNMTAVVSIDIIKKEKTIAVPGNALDKNGDRYYLTIVNGNREETREVKVGVIGLSKVEIVSGVNENENILIDK